MGLGEIGGLAGLAALITAIIAVIGATVRGIAKIIGGALSVWRSLREEADKLRADNEALEARYDAVREERRRVEDSLAAYRIETAAQLDQLRRSLSRCEGGCMR